MVINSDQIKSEAKTAADEVLRAISSDWLLPIDPHAIAERFGIRVIQVSTSSNVAGGLLKKTDTPPVIFINKDDPANRQRFTVAHEIGHYYRHFIDKHVFEYMDYRDQLSSSGTDPDEIFANQFAANLLMPEEQLRQEVDKISATLRNNALIINLAGSFGVSVDAMSIRLKALGIVS